MWEGGYYEKKKFVYDSMFGNNSIIGGLFQYERVKR